MDYLRLTSDAGLEVTAKGTSQDPIPAYDADGATVIGAADVSPSDR